MTESERELKICAADKLLLVKILFEETRFKASSEGREGKTVTESERKKIPDLCSREAKRHGHHAVLLLFLEGRDAKGFIIRRIAQKA